MTKELKNSKEELTFLIEKFCLKEHIIWPREMKLAKSLLQKEPLDFWKFLVLGFDLKSLAWFNSKDGKRVIDSNKKIFLSLQTKKSDEPKDNHEYVRVTEKKTTLKDRLYK